MLANHATQDCALAQMLGTRSTGCCRMSICGDACYQMGQSPERGPNIEHCIGLAEGTEADKSEDTSGRTCLQGRR